MKSSLMKIFACFITASFLISLAADPVFARGGGGGGGGLTAVRVTGAVLVAADDPVWSNATAISVSLWFTDGGGMSGGGSSSVSVKAIHNGTDVAFLLSWSDATLNNVIDGVENFTDAGAIMLNANRIGQMGSPTNPTNIWYWRAVDDSVQNILSGGRGTITRRENAENMIWRRVEVIRLPLRPGMVLIVNAMGASIALVRKHSVSRTESIQIWLNENPIMKMR